MIHWGTLYYNQVQLTYQVGDTYNRCTNILFRILTIAFCLIWARLCKPPDLYHDSQFSGWILSTMYLVYEGLNTKSWKYCQTSIKSLRLPLGNINNPWVDKVQHCFNALLIKSTMYATVEFLVVQRQTLHSSADTQHLRLTWTLEYTFFRLDGKVN